MRQSFSILSIVVLLAGVPIAICDGDSPEIPHDVAETASGAVLASTASGEVLLDSAIAALESQQSLSATTRFQVHLLGHHLFGPGKYLQKGSGKDQKIRFEMAVRSATDKFVFTQVNDGQRLWLLEEMTDKQDLRFMDLQRLRDAGLLTGADTSSPELNAIGLGGLPGLMKNIQSLFQFGRAVKLEWNGMTVWAMRGVWRTDRLAEICPSLDQGDGKDSSKIISKFPEWVPVEVGLLLNTETLFPYRFEFLRTVDVSASKTRLAPIAIMELLEVQFDALIDEEHFDRPSSVRPTDITKEMLRRGKNKEHIPSVRTPTASR